MRLAGSGKVKDVYDAGDGTLVFRFSDRISAYDVGFGQPVPGKGRALCRFAEFWFGRLGVPSHFVGRESETEIRVRRMEMIPLECVVRGYLYGSLAERAAGDPRVPAGAPLASRLPSPIFDPSTKAEHDEPVDREGAVSAGLVDGPLYDELAARSLDIYGRMSAVAAGAGFILADLKLEFGMLDGAVTLGDSIGPDEYRLWPASSYGPGRVQEAYDKQVLRDWLRSAGHKEAFDEARAAGREPVPPEIPQDVISLVYDRYAESYRRLTGRDL